MDKHNEQFNKKKVRLITLTSFLYGFSLALSVYMLSLYYKEVVGEERVGIFFLIEYAILLFFLLNLHKLVKKMSKSFSTIALMAIRATLALSLFLFWSEPGIVGAFVLMTYIISSSLTSVSLDVMLESFSIDKLSGRIRGLYLTILNLGFILGPYYSMRVLGSGGYGAVFKAMLAVDVLIFAIALLGLRGIKNGSISHGTMLSALRDCLGRKDLLRIYFISFVLDFFYATMIMYSLIYMTEIGFTSLEISELFTFMLLPFVLLQYPAGFLADRVGEKKLIVIALIIMSYSTATLFFIDFKNFYLWAVILFMTRVGAALLEILRDSYFYKRIDGDDVGIINLFRTSRSFGYMAFSLCALVMLSFFPVKSVFILLSFIAFLGTYSAVKLSDYKS